MKTFDPAALSAGGPANFSVVVNNAGPSVARDVVVQDTAPDGITPSSATADGKPCIVDGQAITCRLGDLPPGSLVVAASGRLAGSYDKDSVSNTATATSTTKDRQPSNNSNTATATVAHKADLAITKSLAPENPTPGRKLTYTLKATNNGPSDAVDPKISDDLPVDLSDVSVNAPDGWKCSISTNNAPAGDGVTCQADTMPAGADATVGITATLAPGFEGELANTAHVGSATPDPRVDNNDATARTAPSASADLQVHKSMSPAQPVPGEKLKYTITVLNDGPSTARSVKLTDAIAKAIRNTAATSDDGSCTVADDNNVSCHLGSLAPGRRATVTVSGILAPSFSGTLTNSATATASMPDPDRDNNTDTATGNTAPQANIKLTKTSDVKTVQPGGTLAYILTVTNDGPSTAAGVSLSDPLPKAMALASKPKPSQGSCATRAQTLICDLNAIEPKHQATVELTVQVKDGTAPGSLANTAKVTTSTTETDHTDNKDSVAVTVTRTPAQPTPSPSTHPHAHPSPSPSPVPPGRLPETGAGTGVLSMLGIAAAAVLAGAMVVRTVRRRRS